MLAKSYNHPENNLAKFGYILDMKVEKKQNPSIFLATYWNLSQNSGDFNFNFFSPSKSGVFGSFFPGKILFVG
jgi:hypothetical protein